MRARFLIYLIVLLPIFASPLYADELSQVPPVPVLSSNPSLPSLEMFGTPTPPCLLEDATVDAPDIDFWKEKSLFWPVLGKISSGFGPRSDGEQTRIHNGVDIPVPNGTPVQAVASGVVLEARTYTGYGYTVIIDHKDGIKTLYAHCSSLAVSKNEEVESGQVIAYVGSTGRATSPHLHLGVMIYDNFRDPMVYLKDAPQQFVKKP